MEFKKTILPNGARIITVPMQGNPTVTVMVGVATGSFYETADQAGISHFLEHVCFKGTVKRPTPRDITTELDSIGAGYNAFTSREVTGYWAKADVRHFAKIADVVSDIFKNSVFPAAEIEREKGVVLGEIDMYADDPQEKISDAITKHMYKGEPAERDVLGTKETVSALTRDAIVAYRSSQYVAPNTIITIAGGIDEKEMLSWATETFSDLDPSKPKPELPTHDRQQSGPETVFIDKDTDQAHIVMAWRTFPRGTDDQYVARVISNILRGGMSSRLFIKLREEMGAGYYIGAGQHSHKSFGTFTVSTGTKSERVAEIVSAIIAEIERLKTEPVGAAELAKVKEFIRAHRIMGLETSEDVADFHAHQEAIYGEIKTVAELERIYAAITAEDIMRVSKAMFDRNKMTVAVIGNALDKKGIISVL
ncbi:MAG TPA: pitrilysin family protein [Candidatus Paceibacterota bacterium]